MGSKHSSLPKPALSLKSSRARLRKKVARNPRRSIPHQGSPSWKRNRLRWIKRIRATSPEDSVRSIRGFWRFSNRSSQSVEKNDLRVVNCSLPQTPTSIDRYGKCYTPGLDDANTAGADVDSSTIKEYSTSLTEKSEIAASMPKALKIEIKPANAVIGVTGDPAASFERKSREHDEQREMLRHLGEARFLTGSLRSLVNATNHGSMNGLCLC